MGPGIIQVKNTGVLAGMLLHKFDPQLVDIICWVAEHEGLIITESYRPPRHPGDTHATDPVRAMDIRSWVYPDPHKIADAINARRQYDYERPHKQCAVYHDAGNGLHFHIQVHQNTRRRLHNEEE